MPSLFEVLALVVAVGGLGYIIATAPGKIGRIINPSHYQETHKHHK